MVSSDQKERILKMAATGKSARFIAEFVGLGKTTVSNIIRSSAAPPDAVPETSPAEEPPLQAENPPPTITDGAAKDYLSEVNAISPAPVVSAHDVKIGKEDLSAALKKETIVAKFMPKAKKVKAVAHAPAASAPELHIQEQPPAARAPDPTKAELIAKIAMNVSTFGPLLEEHLKPSKEAFLNSLPKMSVADLALTLKSIEITRTVGNAANQLKHILYMAATGIELGGQRILKLKTQGYAQNIRQQDTEIQMILREIALEKVESFKKLQRPELRLALLMSTTMLATDAGNRMTQQPAAAEKSVPPEVEKQFEDL